MENVLIENSSLNKYFKIEYENQNLINNPLYLKWENSIINLKGNGIKLLKCKKDNIIFPCTKKSLEDYQSTCPICNKDICYYFQFIQKDCVASKEVYLVFSKILSNILIQLEKNMIIL